MKWCMKGFEMKDADVLLPRLRHSKEGVVPIRGVLVSCRAAAEQLKLEVKRLGLGNISLHSGKIGAVTVGAVVGPSRGQLKACGGWKFVVMDSYIRVEKLGIAFTDKRLDRV